MDVLEATPGAKREFNAAEIGAIAHLYRGEVYRSTVWRTRLDNTTNWAVAGLGVAMSISFSHKEASALPILLMGGLMVVFLFFETRRYRYFNVWRARCRWLETNWYSPMLLGKGCPCGTGWEKVLSQDYREPQYHLPVPGDRTPVEANLFLRPDNPGPGLSRQDHHPSHARDQFRRVCAKSCDRPNPGRSDPGCGGAFNGAWFIFALVTSYSDKISHPAGRVSMG